MSGPTSPQVYISDTGTSYCVRLPDWESALQTPTACTTEPPLPKGVRRRKRYLRVTATGAEHPVTVLDPADSLYTSAFGTAVSIPIFNSGTPAPGTMSGRTGERSRNI